MAGFWSALLVLFGRRFETVTIVGPDVTTYTLASFESGWLYYVRAVIGSFAVSDAPAVRLYLAGQEP